ncbi:MAG TPA: hypothetical protein VIW80_11980 [Pyrinomonadaceae bacterium]|jgi:hypothetical protein
MSDDEETARAELLQSISEAIERHGAAARGDVSLEEASRAWVEAGFEDAEEVDDWLAARCFSARGAQALERAGITPQQAAMRTRAGTRDYEETIGYKIINDDLSLEEARRIITNAFWNS